MEKPTYFEIVIAKKKAQKFDVGLEETQVSDLNYEQGVFAALKWVLGEGIDPLED